MNWDGVQIYLLLPLLEVLPEGDPGVFLFLLSGLFLFVFPDDCVGTVFFWSVSGIENFFGWMLSLLADQLFLFLCYEIILIRFGRRVFNQWIQFFHFFICQISPFAGRKSFQIDIHNTDAFQFHDIISKVFAHSPNLTVKSLYECDSKCKSAFLNNFAFFVVTPSIGTPLDIPWITSSVRGRFTVTTYSFSCLFPARENFVHDVTIVGKKNQTLWIFVEPANREDTLTVIYKLYNVIGHTFFCSWGDPDRFVQRDKN